MRLFTANSCCKPSIPDHSTFYSDNRYNFGDKVYTKCDTGYVTGGTALRTCQNNGQYTGAPTTCTSEYIEIFLFFSLSMLEITHIFHKKALDKNFNSQITKTLRNLSTGKYCLKIFFIHFHFKESEVYFCFSVVLYNSVLLD